MSSPDAVRRPMRRPALGLLVTCAALCAPRVAAADWEVSFYGGVSLPSYEQRFTLAIPPTLPFPGIDITSSGDFVLDASGGPVFGGAIAWEFAEIFAIEGRIDTASVSLEAGSVRFDVTAQLPPPVGSVRGSLSIGPGSIDLKRLVVLSVNGRVRTPGPLSVYGSGGLSYLPSIEATSAVPLSVEVGGLPVLPGGSIGLRLVAVPGESGYSLGANAGGGVRLQVAGNVSVYGDGRIFGFREFELRFEPENAASVPGLEEILRQAEVVRFTPIYFQAAAGLVVSF
jgi:hypothetical protein